MSKNTDDYRPKNYPIIPQQPLENGWPDEIGFLFPKRLRIEQPDPAAAGYAWEIFRSALEQLIENFKACKSAAALQELLKTTISDTHTVNDILDDMTVQEWEDAFEALKIVLPGTRIRNTYTAEYIAAPDPGSLAEALAAKASKNHDKKHIR